jgi:hypothetical protein
MGELVVRQPHLGRETIALLGRIVDSQADGLAQDDIEPYLLVRLLRCGYIRRQQPDAAIFVATPAGIERCRLEAIAARRRQEEQDRREIIRGRLQATVARLERDYPVAPPPPTLADFGLPTIYQRALRVVEEPTQPALRVGGLRSGQDGLRLATRDDRPRMIRDDAPRATPEDALSVIRDSERRAIRERELPVIQPDDLLVPGDGERPVIHVGRLPEKRTACVPVVREDAVPVVREDAVPAVQEDDVPAILLVSLVDDLPDPGEPADDAQDDDDASQFEPSDEGGGWKRAAVVTAVAAIALLVGDPAFRHLSPSVEVRPQAPIAQSPMLPTPKLATADVVIPKIAAEPSRQSAPVYSAADRVPPRPDVATGTAPEVAAGRAPAPPAVASGSASKLPADKPGPALIAAAHDRETVATRDAPDLRRRPASEAPAPATMIHVVDVATTARADSAAATVVPAVAQPPVAAAPPVVTMARTMAATPGVATPAGVPSPAVVATASAVNTPAVPPPAPATSAATQAAVVPPTVDESRPTATMATQAVATQAVVTPPTAGASPPPTMTPLVATQAVDAPPTVEASRPPTLTAKPVGATQTVVESPAIAALSPPVMAATQVVATQPIVATPAVVASPAVVVAPPIAAMEPVAIAPPAVTASSGPVRARHRLDHAASGSKETLLFASATMNAPAERRDTRSEPQPNAAMRVLDRLRSDASSDAIAVDRLNTLSLLAALQGKTFSPRTVMASVLSRTATSPRPVLPPSLP